MKSNFFFGNSNKFWLGLVLWRPNEAFANNFQPISALLIFFSRLSFCGLYQNTSENFFPSRLADFHQKYFSGLKYYFTFRSPPRTYLNGEKITQWWGMKGTKFILLFYFWKIMGVFFARFNRMLAFPAFFSSGKFANVTLRGIKWQRIFHFHEVIMGTWHFLNELNPFFFTKIS